MQLTDSCVRTERKSDKYKHSFSGFNVFLLASAVLFPVVLLTSCGGAESTSKSTPPPVSPAITAQPNSQTIPIDREAIFTITATGTEPLLYQWYKNGSAIGNANAASYTTPLVTQADNNTEYSVIVSNAAGSVKSSTTTLFAGPRAPALGDLRYLQLEQASPYNNTNAQSSGVQLGAVTQSGTGFLGDTLSMGENVSNTPPFVDCNWTSDMFSTNGLQN